MRDPVRRAAVLSALVIGFGVLVAGILPDLLLEGWHLVVALHTAVGIAAGTAGYLIVSRSLLARQRVRATTAALLTDLDTRERLLAENLQQRRLLEAILEADPDGIAVIAGPDLRYQLVNSAHRRFTPHPEVDPARRPYAEVWHDAGCAGLADLLYHVADSAEAVDLPRQECRYPDGQVRFFDLHLRRLDWEQGQAVLMVLQDDTSAEFARRRAAESAAEARRRADELSAVFEAMVEGVIVFDAEGTPVRANQRAARLIGRWLGRADRGGMAQDLNMHRPGAGLMDPDALPSGQALHGQTVVGDRFSITDPQGREYAIMASASPLLVDGRVAGAVAVWHDVTEIERAESQLRDALAVSQRREAEVAALFAQLATSEERWRSLVENANDAMVTLDARGQILFWNRAAQAMFGHEQSEIIGQPFDSLLAPGTGTGHDRQTWEERLAAASALHGKSLEATGRRRNGEEFPLEYAYAPWHTREGTFITASIRDMTARVQAHERAQRLAAVEERQRLARELHDSVSQALYGIALGANTALTMLDASRERTVAALEYVISLADLALTEMRALIFELRPDALQREGLIAGLAKQTAALRARHGVVVQEALCGEPAVPLEVKESLYRIAQEALNNAVKHAQAFEIHLRLENCGDRLELEVGDNGVGFDPRQTFPGHLGLRSMCERAHQQGGRLDIDSTPGGGTRVRAVIPIPPTGS